MLTANWESKASMRTKYIPSSADRGKELIQIDGESIVIDSSQRWFWSDEWQAGEKRVDKYIEEGNIEKFSSMEDFLSTLWA